VRRLDLPGGLTSTVNTGRPLYAAVLSCCPDEALWAPECVPQRPRRRRLRLSGRRCGCDNTGGGAQTRRLVSGEPGSAGAAPVAADDHVGSPSSYWRSTRPEVPLARPEHHGHDMLVYCGLGASFAEVKTPRRGQRVDRSRAEACQASYRGPARTCSCRSTGSSRTCA